MNLAPKVGEFTLLSKGRFIVQSKQICDATAGKIDPPLAVLGHQLVLIRRYEEPLVDYETLEILFCLSYICIFLFLFGYQLGREYR